MNTKENQKKKILISCLLSAGLVLGACQTKLDIIDPSDDTLLFISNNGSVMGIRRTYKVYGQDSIPTTKGKVVLSPGECMSYEDGQKHIFPIMVLMSHTGTVVGHQNLDSTKVKQEEDNQVAILKKQGYGPTNEIQNSK